MNLRGINRIIFSYVIEIICVIVFVIFSFFVFNTNNLDTYALIAEESVNYKYDKQTSFTPFTVDELNEINEDDLLLAGTLNVKNINNEIRTYNVILYLDDAINVDKTKVYVNGVLVNNIICKDDSIVITQITLKEQEKESLNVLVYGTYAQKYAFKLV